MIAICSAKDGGMDDELDKRQGSHQHTVNDD
jgi:hypothetical protein